jgi:hypothetical protein
MREKILKQDVLVWYKPSKLYGETEENQNHCRDTRCLPGVREKLFLKIRIDITAMIPCSVESCSSKLKETSSLSYYMVSPGSNMFNDSLGCEGHALSPLVKSFRKYRRCSLSYIQSRNLHSEELRNSYSSSIIIRMITSRKFL